MLKADIRRNIFLAATLPMVIISLVFTIYTVTTRQADLNSMLEDKANSLVDYLAGVSQLALFSGDTEALSAFAKAALENEAVVGVAFLDSQGNLLVELGEAPLLE